MTNLTSSDNLTKYYFCDDSTLTVFYSDNINDSNGYVYIGTSDNPKPKMAVAAFTQRGKISEGYRIVEFS